MPKSRIGHMRVELVLHDATRRKLHDLITHKASSVVIPHAVIRHVLVRHVESTGSRVREMHFRHVHVDRLEIAASAGHHGKPSIM